MAEQNAVATQQGTQLSVAAQVKSMISQDAVKKKFTEVLGQKAPQFLASITNVVAGSAQLKKCPATTIMSAAFVAATYDLPIDSNLGFAAIVPYNNNKYNQQTRQWEKHPEAQFQMMYKGFIQLAIRSGYYEKMNCSVVYKDELVSYNPITGEVEFVTDFSKCTQRAEGKSENIAGYYAWFKLLTGFRKELFMTTAEVENHARKYSTAYRYDLENPDEEERIMAGLNVAKLLIIDDLGAERSTDYALEKVYNIIDSRYLSGKPLILTTNMTLKDMQESEDIRYRRIYDRIFEMCFPVRFAGRSWREKAASKRFDAMKNLMEE